MIGKLLDWLVGVTVERKRESYQSCLSCRHWIDYRDPDEDPEEVDGYCGELVDRLGLTEALKQNEYGGHWAHHGDWCVQWQGGEKIWVRNGKSASAPVKDQAP